MEYQRIVKQINEFQDRTNLYQMSVEFPLKCLIQFDHNDDFSFKSYETNWFFDENDWSQDGVFLFCNRRIEKGWKYNYIMSFVINLSFAINQIKIVAHFDYFGALNLVAHSSWLHCQVSCNSAKMFFDPMACYVSLLWVLTIFRTNT